MERFLGGSRAAMVLGALLLLSVIVRASSSGDWVPVGRTDVLADQGVIYSEHAGAFVVVGDEGPIALSEKSPHLGDRIVFCTSSGMFQATGHGEKFDRRGYYYAGPAPRGMDRLGVRVEGKAILVDAQDIEEGPPRASIAPAEPIGPFCMERAIAGERGIIP